MIAVQTDWVIVFLLVNAVLMTLCASVHWFFVEKSLVLMAPHLPSQSVDAVQVKRIASRNQIAAL